MDIFDIILIGLIISLFIFPKFICEIYYKLWSRIPLVRKFYNRKTCILCFRIEGIILSIILLFKSL